MKLDATKEEELVGAMRDATLALLRSRWSEERRAASFDLRAAAMALKKAGSTKEAWRQALIINKMLLDPETEDAVDDVAYTVKLGEWRDVECEVDDVVYTVKLGECREKLSVKSLDFE